VAIANAGQPAPKLPERMPGEGGIWLFVAGETLAFTLFFCVFLYSRGGAVDVYAQSRAHMNQVFGAINTAFMLTSSWLVAQAVHAARRNLAKLTSRLLQGATLCGAGFGVVKFFEYSQKIHSGITLSTNDFYMYYYMFTGIHFMHVLLGMGVLTMLARYTAGGMVDAIKIRNLESGATFWHFVDLLWIILFALFYLLK
jgi:nitric oxide reductase NorE protein